MICYYRHYPSRQCYGYSVLSSPSFDRISPSVLAPQLQSSHGSRFKSNQASSHCLTLHPPAVATTSIASQNVDGCCQIPTYRTSSTVSFNTRTKPPDLLAVFRDLRSISIRFAHYRNLSTSRTS